MDYQANCEVIIKAKEVIALAEEKYGSLPSVEISFSSRLTKTAGYYSKRKEIHKIVFSSKIIRDNNVEEFKADTVVHEVAHFVDRVVNGSTGHNVRFYNMMRTLGNDNPRRCHDFKVEERATFTYACECCGVTMELSKIRHNKIIRGKRYHHNPCGKTGNIKYVG